MKNPKKHTGETSRTFKVRCSREYAFYMFVEAKSQGEAERKACAEMNPKEIDDWYNETTHFNEAYEAEEAE